LAFAADPIPSRCQTPPDEESNQRLSEAHQQPSAAIIGSRHQPSSAVSSSTQRRSSAAVISRHQPSSAAISGDHRRPSPDAQPCSHVLHQPSSAVISRHQPSSAAISSNHQTLNHAPMCFDPSIGERAAVGTSCMRRRRLQAQRLRQW
jgi:hypothetical protein